MDGSEGPAGRLTGSMRRIEEVFLHGVDGVTELWLIRHGDCYTDLVDVIDPPLSELGRRQAARMAERVRQAGITSVYSSDYRRAIETAESIGFPISSDARLREIQNDPSKEPKVVLSRHVAYSESAEEVQARVGEALNEIAALHVGERVAVVTHGMAILLHIAAVMRLEFNDVRLLPYYTSITIVRVHPERTMMGSLVDSTHLIGLE